MLEMSTAVGVGHVADGKYTGWGRGSWGDEAGHRAIETRAKANYGSGFLAALACVGLVW